MNNSDGTNRRIGDEVTGEAKLGAGWYQPLYVGGKVVAEVSLRRDNGPDRFPTNLMQRRIVHVRPFIVHVVCASCKLTRPSCECPRFLAMNHRVDAIETRRDARGRKKISRTAERQLRRFCQRHGMPSIVQIPDAPHTFEVYGLEECFWWLGQCQWVSRVDVCLDVNVYATMRAVGSADASAVDRPAYKQMIREQKLSRKTREEIRHVDYQKDGIQDKEGEIKDVSHMVKRVMMAVLERSIIKAYLDDGKVPSFMSEDAVIDIVLANEDKDKKDTFDPSIDPTMDHWLKDQESREDAELAYHDYVRDMFHWLMTIADIKDRRMVYWNAIQGEKYLNLDSKPVKEIKRAKGRKEESQREHKVSETIYDTLPTDRRPSLDTYKDEIGWTGRYQGEGEPSIPEGVTGKPTKPTSGNEWQPGVTDQKIDRMAAMRARQKTQQAINRKAESDAQAIQADAIRLRRKARRKGRK